MENLGFSDACGQWVWPRTQQAARQPGRDVQMDEQDTYEGEAGRILLLEQNLTIRTIFLRPFEAKLPSVLV
ncbi:hypothetical protein [Rhizobium hainanense]|uniref:hypothetical protein n=1 Tax=Rhizobium hainanense TaxID=52131 RepID=UPI00096A7A4C|nr:hypothetical protein [Rhizobium hainanense]